MLNRHEAETLREAIQIQRDLANALQHQAIYQGGLDIVDVLWLGKVLEAASAGADAVFNTLSSASSGLDDPEAKRAIAIHLGEEVEA